jgi:hypothetical protein
MKDFSKPIPVEWDFIPEFLFHQLHRTSALQKYHVSVLDENGQSISFNMEEAYTRGWKIIHAPKVPDWIANLEKQLEEAILKYREE